MIVKLDPTKYRKYIWYNKQGHPMLYTHLEMALNVTLKAALLFGGYHWRHYRSGDLYLTHTTDV